MADIVIKKRISLDFLGEDYKDAFLTFKAIPLDDIEKVQTTIEQAQTDESKAIDAFKNICREYYLSGQFPDTDGKPQDVTADDLGKFDSLVISKCFEAIAGVVSDPKGENSSTTPSTTVANKT